LMPPAGDRRHKGVAIMPTDRASMKAFVQFAPCLPHARSPLPATSTRRDPTQPLAPPRRHHHTPDPPWPPPLGARREEPTKGNAGSRRPPRPAVGGSSQRPGPAMAARDCRPASPHQPPPTSLWTHTLQWLHRRHPPCPHAGLHRRRPDHHRPSRLHIGDTNHHLHAP
jgi:hypothetical protein